VFRELTEGERKFEQWRFRPGQRLYLRLPLEHWPDQLILPAQAVVVDGPNAYVFREHLHSHSLNVSPWKLAAEREKAKRELEVNGELSGSSTQLIDRDIELEPVPVRLLHRDDKNVVIALDSQIAPGTKVVMNNAQAIYLELKMQASGGSSHGHEH
jgi:membrane fusion protein, heavy metal efflux system